MRFVVSGWYGPGNLGDELILHAIISSLRDRWPNCEICVFSFNPSHTKIHHEVSAVRQIPSSLLGWIRSIVTLSLFKALYALMKADVFIMGGGGFISDWQPDVPKNWLKQMKIAKFFNKKTMLYGVGLGPFNSERGRAVVRYYIDKYIDKITVRDEESKNWLVKCGVNGKSILVTQDPVYALSKEGASREQGETKVLLSFPPLFHNKKWADSEENLYHYKKSINELIVLLTQGGFKYEFVSLMPGDDDKFIESNFGFRAINIRTFDDFERLLRDGRVITLGLRFHFNLVSALLGVPNIPIVYHHKVYSLVKNFEIKQYGEIGNGENWRSIKLDAVELYRHIITVAHEYDAISKQQIQAIPKIRDKEKNNIESLSMLIDG